MELRRTARLPDVLFAAANTTHSTEGTRDQDRPVYRLLECLSRSRLRNRRTCAATYAPSRSWPRPHFTALLTVVPRDAESWHTLLPSDTPPPQHGPTTRHAPARGNGSRQASQAVHSQDCCMSNGRRSSKLECLLSAHKSSVWHTCATDSSLQTTTTAPSARVFNPVTRSRSQRHLDRNGDRGMIWTRQMAMEVRILPVERGDQTIRSAASCSKPTLIGGDSFRNVAEGSGKTFRPHWA